MDKRTNNMTDMTDIIADFILMGELTDDKIGELIKAYKAEKARANELAKMMSEVPPSCLRANSSRCPRPVPAG